MAKIAKKLTDTEIKSTKPADKEINLFDGLATFEDLISLIVKLLYKHSISYCL